MFWRSKSARLKSARTRTQQSFVNKKENPIYISIEPWPHCFELETGEKLTLIYDAEATGDTIEVNVINDRELVLWPEGDIDNIEILVNGEPSDDRNWNFKHADF